MKCLIKTYLLWIQLLLVGGGILLNVSCSQQTVKSSMVPSRVNLKRICSDKLLGSLINLLKGADQNGRLNILNNLLINWKIPKQTLIKASSDHPSTYSYMDIPPGSPLQLSLLDGICSITPLYFQELLSDLNLTPSCFQRLWSSLPLLHRLRHPSSMDKLNEILSNVLFKATKAYYPHLVAALLKSDKVDHTKLDEDGKTSAMYAFESLNQEMIKVYIHSILTHLESFKRDDNFDQACYWIFDYFKPLDKKGRNLLYYMIYFISQTNDIIDHDLYAVLDFLKYSKNIQSWNADAVVSGECWNTINDDNFSPLGYAAQVMQDEQTYHQLASILQHNGADPLLALFLAVEQGHTQLLPRLVRANLNGLNSTGKFCKVTSFLLNCSYSRYERLDKVRLRPKGSFNWECNLEALPQASKASVCIDSLRKKIPELLDILEGEAKENGYIDDLYAFLNQLYSEYAVKRRGKPYQGMLGPAGYYYSSLCYSDPLKGFNLSGKEAIELCKKYFISKEYDNFPAIEYLWL